MKALSTKQGPGGSRGGAALTVCLAVAMSAPFTAVFAGSQPESRIVVRVYNYGNVPRGALAHAETEAQ